MQPVVGSSVAVVMGLATFGWVKGLAALLIFSGVYLVTQSKSRAQVLMEEKEQTDERE